MLICLELFTPTKPCYVLGSLGCLRPDSILSKPDSFENDASHRTHHRPRQAMTARESDAFNDMFSMIFDAAATQENNTLTHDSVVGAGKDGIDDLIGKLRKYPKRLKWSTEMDDVLDRQKEVINLFTSDQELLEWATDAVFGESEKYEAAARKAISEAAASGTRGELPMLQPPTYPHLVALIMQAFREKFNDPHLALSIFNHARNLSTASYVFGCSSQAYHELIVTRWRCFQDLKGVHDALKEMQVNGVKVSGPTRRLVEKLRREIGDRHLWAEESEIGSDEVWNILAQIEKITLGRERGTAPLDASVMSGFSGDVKWDDWKAVDSRGKGQDDWGFDQWDSPPRRGYAEERGHAGGRKFARERAFVEDSMLLGEEEPVATVDSARTNGTLEERELFGARMGIGSRTPTTTPGKGRVQRKGSSRRFGLREEWKYQAVQSPTGVPGLNSDGDEWGFDQVDKVMEQKSYRGQHP